MSARIISGFVGLELAHEPRDLGFVGRVVHRGLKLAHEPGDVRGGGREVVRELSDGRRSELGAFRQRRFKLRDFHSQRVSLVSRRIAAAATRRQPEPEHGDGAARHQFSVNRHLFEALLS
jgi:hypothetical protein